MERLFRWVQSWLGRSPTHDVQRLRKHGIVIFRATIAMVSVAASAFLETMLLSSCDRCNHVWPRTVGL